MKNAIEEMKLQLNYVCYDKEMIPKLSKVWEAFFKIEETFNGNSSQNKQWLPVGSGFNPNIDHPDIGYYVKQ